LLPDFGEDPAALRYLRGGNGGWGNVHFKSSVNQAPRKALPGQPAQSATLRVELRIIADIGFVGFPNAGKSSLLDRFTNARPAIAPYPFTTKLPNLGVLTIDDKDIILADIPGIIEGASDGAGLGLQFLRHISRTAALAFLIDVSQDNYLEAFDTLIAELEAFQSMLLEKPRLVVATKLDLARTESNDADERLAKLRAKYPNETVLGISVFSGEGLAELAGAFAKAARKKTPTTTWS
jgi:GTP-binding protein